MPHHASLPQALPLQVKPRSVAESESESGFGDSTDTESCPETPQPITRSASRHRTLTIEPSQQPPHSVSHSEENDHASVRSAASIHSRGSRTSSKPSPPNVRQRLSLAGAPMGATPSDAGAKR